MGYNRYYNSLDRVPFKKSIRSRVKDFFAMCLTAIIAIMIPVLMFLAACTPLIIATVVVVMVLRFMGVLN